MKRTADVVVIGGGINGSSIAYNLARKGCRDVVVVEKDELCAGASGRCPGGFRHQWGTEADIRLMSASIAILLGLREELDYPDDLEIRQYGYLILAETEEEMKLFTKNVALQQGLGIPVEMLDPKQAAEVAPGLNPDNVLGATFCRWDGRGSPYLITHAYARAARRLGVEFNTGTRVTSFNTAGGRITGVVTDQGTIETGRVICVAGAASTQLARLLDIEIPVKPLRRQMLITESIGRPTWPAMLSHSVVYFQTPHGDAVYVGGTSEEEDTTLSQSNTREPFERTFRAMSRLMPQYRNVKVIRCWGGTYDMSPDAHPIVGPMSKVDGFYMAAGFSGHGFMMAPIVGRSMAEMILEQPLSVDISALSAERFAEGHQVVEKMVY